MDQSRGIFYIRHMSNPAAAAKPPKHQPLGLKLLISNPGLYFLTLFKGNFVGSDAFGNRYFERAGQPRSRRWVIYAGPPEAAIIGPEWHAWLHRLTDAPLSDSTARVWQRPPQANLTGTAASYRPAGHDYKGGTRARSSADYESWSPDKS